MAHSSSQTTQNIAVMLEIIGGSFDDGFTVMLRILEDGRIIQEYDNLPSLPTAPEMPRLYQEWQKISLNGSRKLQAVPAQETNVTELESWKQSTRSLEEYCRTWFNHQEFRSLRDCIRADTKVITDASVPVIIKCPKQHELLHRIPWHVWDLFDRLPNAELTLFSRFGQQVSPLQAPVKVLAIFGSSHGGLNLNGDQKALDLLKQRGAEITLISQPSNQELSDLCFHHDWDILFFAGHSSSEVQSGQIQIRDGDFLQLDSLRQNFSRTVRRGLKLAIFNSCDGLGIADFLGSLGLPNAIVMREPVPDIIARQFLFYFLEQFSQGIPLFLAVRQARDRLEAIQASIFPGASWLPVVCINPSQAELVWPEPTPPQELTNPTPPALPLGLSGLNRRYLLMGLAAIASIFTVATLVMINRCQLWPSMCISQPEPTPNNHTPDISVGDRPITASRVKLSQEYLSFKQQGIENFAQGKYESAVVRFEQLRNHAKQNRGNSYFREAALAALKDPEVLIYRNNAFVRHRHSQNQSFPIYTIAVAAPLNVNAGIDILFGVAQMQDVAVKQGINLEVVIANDNNQTDQAREVAKILKANPKILAVVGHYTSPNTCEALKIYSSEPNPLVVISPTSTVVNLQNCGVNHPKVFFRTVSSTRVEATNLVEYLVNNLKKNQPKVVAFYNSKESFSNDLLRQFETVIKAFQGKIIAKYDLSDPNFNIKQLPPEVNNADAIALLPDGGTGNNEAFYKSIDIIKLNNGNKPILGSNTLYQQNVIDQAKEAIVRSLFIAVDWHPNQCGAQEFAKQVNEYWGGDLNRRTALAYEAVQAILQAIELSGSSVTRQDISQKLANTGIIPNEAAKSATIKGQRISFDARGDRKEITTRAIVTVNSKLQFDLVTQNSCPNPQ
jgi:branched-chain amino acid transport system substrate-binding protein